MSADRPVDRAVRLALSRGELVRDGTMWRFGRRGFNNATVRRLLDRGEAVRVGAIVRAAQSEGTTQ